ncbi:hypothetical protein J6590_058091 [Homalodisca vitripennis]|nr:hypothetical protein J6590_058091 [Homalodisca vitripennis]
MGVLGLAHARPHGNRSGVDSMSTNVHKYLVLSANILLPAFNIVALSRWVRCLPTIPLLFKLNAAKGSLNCLASRHFTPLSSSTRGTVVPDSFHILSKRVVIYTSQWCVHEGGSSVECTGGGEGGNKASLYTRVEGEDRPRCAPVQIDVIKIMNATAYCRWMTLPRLGLALTVDAASCTICSVQFSTVLAAILRNDVSLTATDKVDTHLGLETINIHRSQPDGDSPLRGRWGGHDWAELTCFAVNLVAKPDTRRSKQNTGRRGILGDLPPELRHLAPARRVQGQTETPLKYVLLKGEKWYGGYLREIVQ